MSTRDELQALLQADPTLSAAELARRLGVSRERVRQLTEAMGIRLVRWRRSAPQTAKEPESRIITGGVQATLHATSAGLIGELLVAADLTARGWTVFFPLTRIAACDLVALKSGGVPERVEVRCAKRADNGALRYARPDRAKYDRLALVVSGEPVTYVPPYTDAST